MDFTDFLVRGFSAVSIRQRNSNRMDCFGTESAALISTVPLFTLLWLRDSFFPSSSLLVHNPPSSPPRAATNPLNIVCRCSYVGRYTIGGATSTETIDKHFFVFTWAPLSAEPRIGTEHLRKRDAQRGIELLISTTDTKKQ